MQELNPTTVDDINCESAQPSAAERLGASRVRKALERSQVPSSSPFNGLLTNKLLAAMPGPDFARLLPSLEPVSLVAGENIHGFGEVQRFAYFPETAVIAHLYLLEDGSTSAITLIGNDGMVGLSAVLDSAAPLYDAQVTIGGNALRIDAEVLKQEFLRGAAMQQLLLNYTGARLAQVSQKAVCNLRHRLDERLCTWLLMLHDRARDKALRLTHEKIANYLGTRRAGVSSACNALRAGGIIHYQRGTIRIIERELLEKSACECYQAFQQIVAERVAA